jgi:hypothetical protein
MLFVIQKEDGRNYNDVEFAMLTEIIHAYSGIHDYITMSESELYNNDDDDFGFEFKPKLKTPEELDPQLATAIPIGNISFVEKFLKIYHNIEHEISIEIPPCLRQERFLKRKYSIVPVWEIPRKGNYFIKDATQQKVFSHKGELEDFLFDEMFEPKSSEYDMSLRLDYEHLYQVSEVVNVMAEYRVYVLGGKVETISHFAGNPFKLPDVELIRDAVEIYNQQPDCPKSYSLDVMITPQGTAITEIHNFMCLGLYNVNWDENLLYAYRDGWNYVLNYNTEQTEFSNFAE